jgi:hypothetical protein
MGATAVLTPKRAVATVAVAQPCYVCYHADICPDNSEGDAICAANTPCSTMIGCTDVGPECPFPGYLELYCG